MNDVDELERALSAPWEKWITFLHPAQREWVERDYSGPARVGLDRKRWFKLLQRLGRPSRPR